MVAFHANSRAALSPEMEDRLRRALAVAGPFKVANSYYGDRVGAEAPRSGLE